jgi:hypothetical protein
MRLKDLMGQRFERLVVIEYHKNSKKWLCKCDCGNFKEVSNTHLRDGHTKSCGCLNSEITSRRNFRHGLYGTRLYRIYAGILQRCLNESNPAFPDYGGRGIRICDEWRSNLVNFVKWALSNGYADNLSIDRENVNGNYEPSNCRWITQKAQCNNVRRNIMINGHTLKEECEELGLKYNTVYMRIIRGHTLEEAIAS